MTIPKGWKLVPIEPTQEMIDAGRMARMNIQGGYGGPGGWEAMLAAAPESPTPVPTSGGIEAELLAALRQIVNSCASALTPMSEGQTRMVTAPSRDALVAAHAAIAKAEDSVSEVMVTDEMVKRFANVYYGGGVPHLMNDIRYALFFAITAQLPPGRTAATDPTPVATVRASHD